jgi:hypothetical protein
MAFRLSPGIVFSGDPIIPTDEYYDDDGNKDYDSCISVHNTPPKDHICLIKLEFLFSY